MPAKSFLVIRLSSLGDIVHALPAVSALAQIPGGARIDWLIEPRYKILLERNPHVRNVVEIDTRGKLSALRRSLAEVRRRTYDAVIDFQGLLKSAVLGRFARAAERVGFAEPWLREPVAGAFYTHQIRLPDAEHVVEENLGLVKRWGADPAHRHQWRFPLPDLPEARDRLEEKLKNLGVQNSDLLIVNPGGGWAAKRWPAENFAALLTELAPACPLTPVVTYGPGEEVLAAAILEGSGNPAAVSLATDIPEFIALARRAKLFVGTDTGPLHLSTAVGTPVVGIYGPTNPKRHGPFSPLDIVLHRANRISHSRRNPHAGGIREIGVGDVANAVRARLETTDDER